MAAHRLVAVSHGYAWECQTQEGGWGLDKTLRELSWKFRGIVNGVDLEDWNPGTDEHLRGDGYANYTLETMKSGKAKNKVRRRSAEGRLGFGFRGLPMVVSRIPF
jgi:starch synthase